MVTVVTAGEATDALVVASWTVMAIGPALHSSTIVPIELLGPTTGLGVSVSDCTEICLRLRPALLDTPPVPPHFAVTVPVCADGTGVVGMVKDFCSAPAAIVTVAGGVAQKRVSLIERLRPPAGAAVPSTIFPCAA